MTREEAEKIVAGLTEEEKILLTQMLIKMKEQKSPAKSA